VVAGSTWSSSVPACLEFVVLGLFFSKAVVSLLVLVLLALLLLMRLKEAERVLFRGVSVGGNLGVAEVLALLLRRRLEEEVERVLI
jgi:O-antigen ligase